MAVCSICAQENPEGFRFCGACGAVIAARGAPLEERRVVTVLFTDLVGFTSRAERLDPEDVRRIQVPFHTRVRAELERLGGRVEKYAGDAIMGLFGAAVTHGDDPERAVRAALAIGVAVSELNAADPSLDLHVRTSVATGEALVALGARPELGETMASGDVINTCSRLQRAAPVDGVVVGEATYRATAAAFAYRPVEPVQAKGKAQPVPAWEVLGLRERPAAAPLVGRRAELDRLVEAVERARSAAAPELVVLSGAPGIGKSRLVAELLARLEGFESRTGCCLPYGNGVTFWALGEMVKEEAGILESDDVRAAGRKLDAAVGNLLPGDSSARLRPLLGLGDDGQPGPDERGSSFAAWTRFLSALAGRSPLVLVLEDVHWADDGLLDFLEHLVARAGGVPLAVVCTAWPELLERRPAWRRSALELDPLSAAETEQLLGALLAGREPPREQRERLLAAAAGNPLYAEEYARMLADGGGLAVPETVQGLIAARLDLLPSAEKALLQDAAIVGRVFWPSGLAALGAAGVAEGLEALAAKGFVRREQTSTIAGEPQLSFHHVLVRDVVYAQIPRARRAERHRLAAEWLGSLAGDRSEDLAELRAHHSLHALRLARATGGETAPLEEPARLACREAGDRALALSAFATAARFYADALGLWPADDPERAQLLLRAGRARFWAEGAGEEELAGAAAAADQETAAEAEALLSRLLLTRGDRLRAVEVAESAAARLAGAPASRAQAYALANLGGIRVYSDDLAGAAEGAERALEIAVELGLDDLAAHALNTIGFARGALGDPGGVADLERSVELAERIGSPECVRGWFNLGSLLANLGDLERAFECYEQGREAAERFGDARGLQWFASERLWQRYCRGEWDDALGAAAALAEEAGPSSPVVELDCSLVRAAIVLARGDGAAAAGDAVQALELARRAGDPRALAFALVVCARALAATGASAQAGALATELLDTWTRSGLNASSLSIAAVDLADLLWELGRGEELVALTARVAAPTPWIEAAAAAAAGDFARAAELCRDIGSRADEQRCLRRAAAAVAPV